MKKLFSSFIAAMFLALIVAGCGSVGVGVGVGAEFGGETDPAKAKVENAGSVTAAPAAAPAKTTPAPAPTAEAAPPPPENRPTMEEVQKKREMEAGLRSAFDEFWGLVKQKNVDSASEMISIDKREEIKNEFYRFIAKYSVSRFEITELTTNFGTPSDSEIAGYVMIFEKGGLTPIKKEIFQRWKQSGKWYLTSSIIK